MVTPRKTNQSRSTVASGTKRDQSRLFWYARARYFAIISLTSEADDNWQSPGAAADDNEIVVAEAAGTEGIVLAKTSLRNTTDSCTKRYKHDVNNSSTLTRWDFSRSTTRSRGKFRLPHVGGVSMNNERVLTTLREQLLLYNRNNESLIKNCALKSMPIVVIQLLKQWHIRFLLHCCQGQ